MNADVVIIGAGPAGIFTALEMIKKGSHQKIIMVEKGQAVENRHCPKDKTKKCVNCKPYCHITTGFSGAGAFSDGKLSLSYEVGGDLPTLITPELAQETINYADQIYLDFGADEHIEGLGNDEERKEIRKHEIQAPIYDPNEEPIMDNIRIRQLLPHRYPMQLVDKVIAMGPNSIVGVKNVTSNEPFFTGHFPEEPVMPGVLQVEAMAQCGGLLVLNQLEEPERWSTYFMKLDDVKFRKKVVPGDTLLFRVELLAPVRHGISSMKGYMFVGDQVVAEATFTAQIVKNK